MNPDRRAPLLSWIQGALAAGIFFLVLGAALLKDARHVPAPKPLVASDRDWNQVNGFWGGLPELYRMTTAK